MIGNKLKELRDKKGLTLKQMGEILGVSHMTYQRYEKNDTDVSTEMLAKIADFYGVTTDYLLGREPPNDPFEMLGLDTSSKNVVEEFAGLPDDSRKFILDIVIKLAHAAEGKSGEVSAPDYGPMRHSATYKELKRGSDAEAKKNA